MPKYLFRALTATALCTRSGLNLVPQAVVIVVACLIFTSMALAQAPQRFVSARNGNIDHTQLEKNDTGMAVYGNVKATIRDSAAVSNTDYGFSVMGQRGTAAEMNLEHCVATGNSIGVLSTSGIAG